MTGNGKIGKAGLPRCSLLAKEGGYLDWLRHEESRQLVTDLAEHQAELNDAAQGLNHENYQTNPKAKFDFTNKFGPIPCVWTPVGWKNEPKCFGVPPSGGFG
ncbi:MAG: hypothetical protein ABSE16_04940 [Verrucomicrobiota bacterium]|jgi:hypothetical protein